MIRIGACAAALPLASCANQLRESAVLPNIVLILSDDHGLHQAACYRHITGNTFYETPNLDRLAREGMCFDNAYAAAPICSPTRASIMTGKSPARLHLTDWIPGWGIQNQQLMEPDWTKFLPLEETTLPEMLRPLGYVNGHFGKWHLNKDTDYAADRPMDPGSQGFDEVMTAHKPKSNSTDPDSHAAVKITEAALTFIETNRQRPFFCYIAHNLIHIPFLESADAVAKYKARAGSDRKENDPVVGAMVETLDRNVGRVLDTLDQLGLANNTIVMFMGDNGASDAIDVLKPLRGGKAQLYEGGIRVPFLMRWPAAVKSGTQCSEPVISNDIFPTLVEAAGGKVRDHAVLQDSRSLIPLFCGDSLRRQAIHWHYPHYHKLGLGPCGAIRQGRYKLIEWYEKSNSNDADRIELYDLQTDLSEQRNLTAENPEQAARLLIALRDWRKRVGAQEMVHPPAAAPLSDNSSAG